jgi:hypothetical protein
MTPIDQLLMSSRGAMPQPNGHSGYLPGPVQPRAVSVHGASPEPVDDQPAGAPVDLDEPRRSTGSPLSDLPVETHLTRLQNEAGHNTGRASETFPLPPSTGTTTAAAPFSAPEQPDTKSHIAPSTRNVGESPARDRYTEAELLKGAERVQLLRTSRELRQGGHSLEVIAALTGSSAPTICRLLRQYEAVSDAQLTPELCAAAFTNSGRRSRWEDLAANPLVQQRLQQLYLKSAGASAEVMTRARRTGSLAATLLVFTEDDLCPLDLRRELRQGKMPTPLIRVIRRMNDLHEQMLRGEKHRSLNAELIQKRSLIEILADGQQRPIQRGDWWVFDDMSDNLPHWWTAPDGQPLVGRQGLYCYDLTREWLGVEKIGNARDAYSSALILRFLRRLMEQFGKPRRGVVLERGVWASRNIKGVRLAPEGLGTDEWERPVMSDADKQLVQDGLQSLGLIVHYTYTPRGKEIEAGFNYLQKLKAMMAPQGAVNIGRHAGEFEHAAKQLRRARAQSHHPQDLGFLHMDASRDLDLKVMDFINARGVRAATGEGFGQIPYPELADLSPRDRAVFLPEQRELMVRNGCVATTVRGEELEFCAPELFAELGSGYRLLIRFDPEEPTLGAALYNRETSSANFHNWQQGEFIGWAEVKPRVARFNWSGQQDAADDLERRYNRAVRTSFGAVGLNHRVATARDGRGNTAVVQQGTGGRAAVSAPVPSEPVLPKRERKPSPLSLATPSQFSAQADRIKRRQEQRQRVEALAGAEP